MKMFGKKKKEKKEQNVTTYVDGEKQESGELPVPQPDLASRSDSVRVEEPAESPALEPEQVPAQEPSPQQFDGECILCFDFRWYADSLGVWHACPRCNPKGTENRPKADGTDSQGKKPRKGNLYEFRYCKECGAQHEIHKKKKKWKCEECGVTQ